MPEYKYRAKDTTGKVISSNIEADSREDAIENISRIGYYPLSVEESSSEDSEARILMPFFDRISMRKHITAFTRQLGGLLKSGMPMLKALDVISVQCPDKRFKKIVENIFSRVKDGKPLSSAISGFRNYFNAFYISMVRVGEDNGKLPDILRKLVEHRRKQDEITSKIKGALTYPALVAIVGFFSVMFIFTSVLPKIIDIIEGTGSNLPKVTTVLIGIISFFEQYSLVIWIILGLVWLLIWRMHNNNKDRLAIDSMKLHVPIFGRLILESELVRFFRTLETSLESGLLLLKALELSLSVVDNEAIKKELSKCYTDVQGGLSLGSILKKSRLFPGMVSSMIAVGEESGRLTETLEQISEDFELRVNETTQTMMTLLEPAIIIILGAIVGFVVMALLMPIFSLDILAK